MPVFDGRTRTFRTRPTGLWGRAALGLVGLLVAPAAVAAGIGIEAPGLVSVSATLTSGPSSNGGLGIAASANVPLVGTSAGATATVEPAGTGAALSVEAQSPVVQASTGVEVGIEPPVSPPDVGIDLPVSPPQAPTVPPSPKPVTPSSGTEPRTGPPPTPTDRPAPMPQPSSGYSPGPGLRSGAGIERRASQGSSGSPARPAGRPAPRVRSLEPRALPARPAPTRDRDEPSAGERVLRAVAASEPALTAIFALLAAFGVYLGVQRRLDGGPRLASVGDRHPPDDEKITF